MKLISRVSCPDDAFGCDYAVIDLTPSLARLALKRIEMLKGQKRLDNDLYETCFWDYHAEFFCPWTAEGEGCGDALAQAIEECPAVAGDWMEGPAGFVLPEPLVARMEASRMVVMDDGIYFIAILKHTDFTLSTGELPIRTLEAAAA